MSDRDHPRAWEEKGAQHMWQRANQKARGILASHHPIYLQQDVDRKIRERFNILLPASM